MGEIMTWKTIALSLLSLALVSGCASSPDKMQKAYVSPTQYENMTCSQLGAELQRVSDRKVELYRQLKNTADNDAIQMGVGLVLFWPTLFFLEGGDGPQASEYSHLLGESDTIEKILVKKDCNSELVKVKAELSKKEDVQTRLKKLDELLQDGTITQEEFDAKRKQILSSI